MEGGGVSDDEISLTSTVESEQESEYEVETILAEEEFPDGMRFLVRWLGYSIDRCTWEPAGSFNFGETLRDWGRKKQQISEGKESAFDVAAWEARLVRLQEERDERKRKRLVKRLKFSASEANSTPVKRAPTIRRTNSDKSLSGATSRQPGPAPKSLFQDGVHPARQGLLGSSAQRLPPVLFGSSQSTPDSSQPKKPSGTDKPKLFKNLSTKWRYEKLGRTEPAPDKNQLDLRRPAEWAPISSTDIAQLGPRLGTDIADHSRKDHASNDPLDSPRSSHRNQRSPVTSSIPNNNSWNVSNPELIETRSEPINNIAAHHGSAKPASEFNLEFPPRKPDSTSKFLHSGRWWNRGELYVTIYLGPEKLEIGDVRLCGIPFEQAKGIFKMKVGKVIELWFKDLCTLDEYNALCHGMPNKKIANGWVEGFDDNEPTVRRAAMSLWQANQVAIAHINRGWWDEILLAYPPGSPDFNFLDAGTSWSERGYLHLTLRGPLGPKARLNSGAKIYPHLREMNNTSIGGNLGPTTVNVPSGVKPSRSIDVAQENTKPSTSLPTLDLPDTAIYTPSSLNSPTTPILSSKLTVHKTINSTESMNRDARSTEAEAPDGSNLHTAPDLDELLYSKFGISFKKLATISNTEKPQRAEMFFVWFPDDSELVRNEKELILTFLRKQTSLLFYNSVDVDWERFVTMVKKNTMQGVVLFHESFVQYETIPFLKEILRKTPAFWNISISQPLKYAGYPVHAQRLFPHGGVILLTEDFMVREPDAATIILGWFCEYTRTKIPGNWKIMVRPDISNWLLKQVEVSDKTQKSWWLAISHLLGRLGLSPTDGRLPSIEDDHSSVISPSTLPRYGSRTSDDCPTIPNNCTQEQRNTDHLAEFFAGWSIVNAHRFRRFSMVTALEPLKRWTDWQHIDVRGPQEFYHLYQIDPKRIHATMLQEAPGLSTTGPSPYAPRTPMPSSTPAGEQRSSSSATQSLFQHTYGQPYQ